MSSIQKLQYDQFVLTSNKEIQDVENQIDKLKKEISTNKNSNRYSALAIVTNQLRIINIYFQQDDKYFLLFENHNKPILENVRKMFGEIVAILKTHFNTQIHDEFSKPSPYLTQLTHLTPQRILNLISQLEYLYIQLKQKFGQTSKYLISLASIYGDICGFAINIIDFPKYINIVRDLSNNDYKVIKELLDLVESMIEKSSEFYIDSYQNSDNDKEQVRNALKSLNTLETYYRITGKKEEIDQLSRKKQSWERYLS